MLASVLTDWIIAVGSALGAVATFAAVLVALFGPQWRDRRVRPALSVKAESFGLAFGLPQDDLFFLEVMLRNEPRRAMARDVEVAATVSELPNERGGLYRVPDVPLSFSYPRPGAPPQTVTHIAPGHFRTAYVIGLGGKVALSAALNATSDEVMEPEGDYGVVVASADAGYLCWIEPDQSFDVTLIATGSNFDAVRFRGQLRLTVERANDEGDPDPYGKIAGMKCDWTKELTRER